MSIPVLLGIGSNVERERHLHRGLDALQQLLGPLRCSPVFESEAVGVLGKRFYNMVVAADCRLSLPELQAALKAVEAACGRREARSAGSITLDIDILVYGELHGVHHGIRLPRAEITRNAFVLWPLALLAGDVRLPGDGRSYAELWAGWQGNQGLWPVAFEWRSQALTPASLLPRRDPGVNLDLG